MGPYILSIQDTNNKAYPFPSLNQLQHWLAIVMIRRKKYHEMYAF